MSWGWVIAVVVVAAVGLVVAWLSRFFRALK